MANTDASLKEKLKAASGWDEVDDLLFALRSLPVAEIAGYLSALLGEMPATAEIANEIAATSGSEVDDTAGSAAAFLAATGTPNAGHFYRKSDEGEGGSQMRPTKGGAAHGDKKVARSELVGGATVAVQKRSAKQERHAARKGSTGLDALRTTMLPGRQPCLCNARRHALLCNCLSCGKVICEQEGEGLCLYCGADPDVPYVPSAAGKEEAEKAVRQKERLLDYDKSSAKRTTVIDDQADYFSHAGSDAWLTAEEKTRAESLHRQRDEEAARKRRELRVTLDFGSRSVVREGQEQACSRYVGCGACLCSDACSRVCRLYYQI